MNSKPLFLCFLWMVCWDQPVFGRVQQQENNSIEQGFMEELMELLSEDQLEEVDWSDLLEYMTHLRAHPLDLNKVLINDLTSMVFLSPLLARNILYFREQTGGFISVNELQAVEGMDLRYAKFLEQFFYVGVKAEISRISYGEMLRKGRHELLMRYGRILEKQAGYRVSDSGRSRYLGSPDRILLRYRYEHAPGLKIAVNMEKDAGEQFFSGAQRLGFDFYGGSIQLVGFGPFSKVVIGDYILQFGQGLGIWSGYALGKGALLHGIARQGMGLKQHTSADETAFLRGLSVVFSVGRVRLTPFISHRYRDAAVLSDTLGNRSAAALGQSGLHRTPNEAANRFAVSQFTYGMNAQLDYAWSRFGGTIYHNILDVHLLPQPLLRNQYKFSGRSLVHGSIYYQTNFRNMFLFGELAHGASGGGAMLHGALLHMHHHISLALLHRYYERDHQTFLGSAFGENSTPDNEKGFYIGLQYQPNRKFSWVLYQDAYRFPWLRYRVDAASYGKDLATQFSYSWSRKGQINLRFRYQKKQENQTGSVPFSLIEDIQKYQLRAHFEMDLSRGWAIRSRAELLGYGIVGTPTESALMFFQDAFYQPMGAKFSGNIRLAFFNTPSYNSRIYAYESDLLYSGGFSAYYQRGWRTYFNMRCRLGSSIDLWMRYAATIYEDNRQQTGSGLDQSDGPVRSDLKIQLRIRIP